MSHENNVSEVFEAKPSTQSLKDAAMEKLREAEKAIYAWASEEEVGPQRTIAFEMYEIVRTAPREANRRA